MSCESINSRKFDYYINNPNAIIIDLRDRDDYLKRRIKNSINIPFNTFEEIVDRIRQNYNRIESFEFDGKIVELRDDKIYVLYCDRGSMSMIMCSKLAAIGLNVKTLVGGITHYQGNYLEGQFG